LNVKPETTGCRADIGMRRLFTDRLCCIRLKEKILKSNHPVIAVTLNNLAVLYKSQGRLNEAEALYSRSLSIFKNSLADKHPHVTSCQANYARLKKLLAR